VRSFTVIISGFGMPSPIPPAASRPRNISPYGLMYRLIALMGRIGWYASPGMVQDSAAALWTALFSRPDVQPGQTLAGFWFEAVGLPNNRFIPGPGALRNSQYTMIPLPWLYQSAPSFLDKFSRWVHCGPGTPTGLS